MSDDSQAPAGRIVGPVLAASALTFLAAGVVLLLATEQTLFGGVLLAIAMGDALVAFYFLRRRAHESGR